MSVDSPNPLNYFIGTGVLYWTPSGGSERELGNATSVKLAPSIETKEHKNFQSGAAVVDQTSITGAKLTFSATLDEISIDNLAIFFFGTVTTNTAGNKEFTIFAAKKQLGAIRFAGSNDQGNQFGWSIDVQIVPAGEFEFIGEDYGTLPIEGTVTNAGADYGTIEETLAAS